MKYKSVEKKKFIESYNWREFWLIFVTMKKNKKMIHKIIKEMFIVDISW